jgi:hypothetical protein
MGQYNTTNKSFVYIMKRKFKQWWSTIPPILTKRTITSHLKSYEVTNVVMNIKCVPHFKPPKNSTQNWQDSIQIEAKFHEFLKGGGELGIFVLHNLSIFYIAICYENKRFQFSGLPSPYFDALYLIINP